MAMPNSIHQDGRKIISGNLARILALDSNQTSGSK
jgi:hypothetical protein